MKNYNREEIFTQVFQDNFWKGKQSKSGKGSSLSSTKNIRTALPKIFAQFDVETVFDAACGDMFWMGPFLQKNPIQYIGADIVKPMIEQNTAKYGNETTTFVQMDLVTDKFPTVDLVMVRDLLFHMSDDDIYSLLKNFVDSGSKYLLTTTHYNFGFKNSDLETWGWSLLDLFSDPYSFPQDYLYKIVDASPGEFRKEMYLWSNEQIASVISNRKPALMTNAQFNADPVQWGILVDEDRRISGNAS